MGDNKPHAFIHLNKFCDSTAHVVPDDMQEGGTQVASMSGYMLAPHTTLGNTAALWFCFLSLCEM